MKLVLMSILTVNFLLQAATVSFNHELVSNEYTDRTIKSVTTVPIAGASNYITTTITLDDNSVWWFLGAEYLLSETVPPETQSALDALVGRSVRVQYTWDRGGRYEFTAPDNPLEVIVGSLFPLTPALTVKEEVIQRSGVINTIENGMATYSAEAEIVLSDGSQWNVIWQEILPGTESKPTIVGAKVQFVWWSDQGYRDYQLKLMESAPQTWKPPLIPAAWQPPHWPGLAAVWQAPRTAVLRTD